MAKKKTKKLPKTIGGMKIPKKMRKSGGELLDKVNTPLGRELIAAGLVAAGAAIARKKEARQASGHAAEAVEDAAEKGARMAGQIGGIVGAAATAALDRIFGPSGEARPEDAAAPPAGTARH